MNLQTKIQLKKQSEDLIDYNSNMLLLGSCFSNNIGAKLDYFKFQNLQNPFGILFQPKAIENLITNAINEKVYSEKDIFFENGQWHSFEAHSKLSHVSEEDLLNNLNTQIKLTNEKIHDATHIIITLGTAWVYRFLETNQIVANCHKVPPKQFIKELLSVEAIEKSLLAIINLFKSVNVHVSIIFTVSPVRHLKDGFVENTLSKSHLITAIHSILNNDVFYFPSYEIMMDELRDYRFYAEDMIHPNQTAINYIWEKFSAVWVSDNALKTMEAVDDIQKGIQHKPFNANSLEHKNFLKKLENKKLSLQEAYPNMVF